jgi:prefoldin alpha subunit
MKIKQISVFLRGNLVDDKKVLVNVGSNVVIEKNIDEAKEIINAQIEEIEKVQTEARDEFSKYLVAMQQIQEEFEKLQA